MKQKRRKEEKKKGCIYIQNICICSLPPQKGDMNDREKEKEKKKRKRIILKLVLYECEFTYTNQLKNTQPPTAVHPSRRTNNPSIAPVSNLPPAFRKPVCASLRTKHKVQSPAPKKVHSKAERALASKTATRAKPIFRTHQPSTNSSAIFSDPTTPLFSGRRPIQSTQARSPLPSFGLRYKASISDSANPSSPLTGKVLRRWEPRSDLISWDALEKERKPTSRTSRARNRFAMVW